MAAKKPRKALGRGLGALLQDSETSNKPSNIEREFPDVETVSNINEIPINQIEVNPFQPRSHFDKEALDELADSIKTQGIIQPITVRKLSDDS
ncbi:chromosome partitioning protein ParB, partial [Marivirga lumbricoides]